MKTKFIVLLSFLAIMACTLPTATPPPPTATPRPTIPPDATGMIVHGRVTLNGLGLAGVSVYKRFNAYPRELIAVTDDTGYYESNFIFIAGDEMVSIEVELEGYTFEPPYHYWRHYYGFVEYTRDFTASPAVATNPAP